MESLGTWASEAIEQASSGYMAALELARMALRLADDVMLAQATQSYHHTRPKRAAPIFEAKVRWVDALAAGDHAAVEAAAATFEELGYLIHAADAWADAAILAARAGVSSDAEARAIGLCEEMGMHPLLGPLPETRWTGALSAEESRAGA